jgi:hypothetical protein
LRSTLLYSQTRFIFQTAIINFVNRYLNELTGAVIFANREADPRTKMDLHQSGSLPPEATAFANPFSLRNQFRDQIREVLKKNWQQAWKDQEFVCGFTALGALVTRCEKLENFPGRGQRTAKRSNMMSSAGRSSLP